MKNEITTIDFPNYEHDIEMEKLFSYMHTNYKLITLKIVTFLPLVLLCKSRSVN